MTGAATVVASVAASLCFLLAYCPACAAGDRGFQLAAGCAACHRLDRPDIGIPSGAGLDEEGVVRVLRAYRSGERQSQIMRAVTRSLGDADIGVVAHYLAALRREVKEP
jgi:cytochrome c553